MFCDPFLLFRAPLFFFKQKTAYERRISDWSSDVCSSDLGARGPRHHRRRRRLRPVAGQGGDAGRTGGRFLGGRTGAPGLPAETSRRLHLPLRAPRLEAPAPRRRGLRPGFIAAGCFAGDGFRCALPILRAAGVFVGWVERSRSEEHTSELQSLMRISYAVFCLKKKT